MRRIYMAALSGLLAGLSSAIFLYLLKWATEFREGHSWLIWLLPIAGWTIGWFYLRYGTEISSGNNLILEEIHNPKKPVPLRMAPFVLLGTVATHLFGGSAGREGTAVQMGATLSDQVANFLNATQEERRRLLICGAGAGFGAAIGAPLAGAVFGLEVLHVRGIKPFAWLECIIASFVAFGVVLAMQAPHSVFPKYLGGDQSFKLFLIVALAGVAFGLSARLFVHAVHLMEKILSRFPLPWKTTVGGFLLALLFLSLGLERYAGLGIPVIQQALQEGVSVLDPIYKMFFTALTIAAGFKGGEFIPLVFIGASLGSVIATWAGTSIQVLASVGFAAVFAGASNTPLACTIMAIELFGFSIAPYALLGCGISFLISGSSGIYRSQRP